MRVLHICLTKNLGGIERFLMTTAQNIEEYNIRFEYVIADKEISYESEMKKINGVLYYIGKPLYVVKYFTELWKIIKYGGYDVIHIHKNSLANPIPIYMALFLGKKFIVHSHNTAPKVGGALIKLLHYINRFILQKKIKHKIACSPKAYSWMYGVYNNEYSIILRNGIDISRFKYSGWKREVLRRKIGIPNKAFVIGNVSAFIEQKNHKKIVDIFCELIDKIDAYLVLVGDGPLQDSIRILGKKRNIEKRIIFTGALNDVSEYYQLFDVLLMPSLYEGLPIAAIEAQAADLPVLISDVVDHDVKIISKLEYEKVSHSSKVWALHLLKMYKKYGDDRNCLNDSLLKKYDTEETAKRLSEIYNEMIIRENK